MRFRRAPSLPEARGAGAAGLAALRAEGPGSVGSRLAAAGAAARARGPAASAHAAAVRDVAAGIAAPALIGYVAWLLLDARDRGLGRLYFLSRDGEVLKEIADILAPRLGIGIERRYLHASRQAWNRALGTAHFDRWLWHDSGSPSPADILRRLAVPPEAVADDLAGLGFPDPEVPLDEAGVARMRGWLDSDRFAAAAAGTQAESRRLLEGYLAQEGIFDGVPAAVVDLGWTGSQHETLCGLLDARGLPPLACYLFGAVARASAWSGLRRGFYFDEGRGEAARDALPPRDLYTLMETFCTAADGTLTGFARSGDGIVPVCAPDRRAVLETWGLPGLRATLHAAACAVETDGLAARDLMALRGTLGRLLETFWQRPSPAEARAWGAFPWDAGQGHEGDVFPLADRYTLADMAAAWAPQRLRKREIFWVEGAFAITPAPVAAVLRAIAASRAASGWLRRAGRRAGRRRQPA